MLLCFLLIQAAPPPDIELHATVRARSLTIEKKGSAELTVTSDPPGKNIVEVHAPEANGKMRVANPVIEIKAEVRIAEPARDQPPRPPR